MTLPIRPYCTVPLTQGQVALIDVDDLPSIQDVTWYAWWSAGTRSFYAMGKLAIPGEKRRRTVLMHRMILGLSFGDERIGDHKQSGVTLDNRRSNLRIVTTEESSLNKRKYRNNRSGFKGVYFEKERQKWRAQIRRAGKKMVLGRFDTPEEAYAAYCEASASLHGEHGSIV